MKRSKKNLQKIALITTLKKCKPSERANIIQFLDEPGVDIVGECIHNVLFNDLNLNTRTKKRLKKRFGDQKKLLSILADKNKSVKKRKNILLKQFQRGGSAWSFLLSVIIPILGKLILGHQ